MKARHLLILLTVLCFPTRAAFAQDDSERMAEVLCLGDQECLTLARYRLSADGLRRMFAADGELAPLLKDVSPLHERMREVSSRIDPQQKLGTITLSGQVFEAIPEIAQILRRHQLSGRDYAFTHAVAMVTAMTDDMLSYEAQTTGKKEVPPALLTPALKFWRSMDPALRAEANAWKKMRGYDKGINR